VSNPYAPPPAGATPPDRRQPGPGGPPAGAHDGRRPPHPPHQPEGHDPRQGQRPPQGRPPVLPPDPEAARVASRRVLHFGLLMLATVLTSSLPLPWGAASIAFVLLSLVVGVRALVALRRARVRGVLAPMLTIGLVFSTMLALTTVSMVATWPVQSAREDCLRSALTVSAQARCEKAYQEDLITWQQDLIDRASRG